MKLAFFCIFFVIAFTYCTNTTQQQSSGLKLNCSKINYYFTRLSNIHIDSVSLWNGALIGLPHEERFILPMGEYSYPDSLGFTFLWYNEGLTNANKKEANNKIPFNRISTLGLDFDYNLTTCFAFSQKMIPPIDRAKDMEGWLSQRDMKLYIYPDTTLIFIRKAGVWEYFSAEIVNSREEYDVLRNNTIRKGL